LVQIPNRYRRAPFGGWGSRTRARSLLIKTRPDGGRRWPAPACLAAPAASTRWLEECVRESRRPPWLICAPSRPSSPPPPLELGSSQHGRGWRGAAQLHWRNATAAQATGRRSPSAPTTRPAEALLWVLPQLSRRTSFARIPSCVSRRLKIRLYTTAVEPTHDLHAEITYIKSRLSSGRDFWI
jgi:hypothetical protein